MTECCIFKNNGAKEKKVDFDELEKVEVLEDTTRHYKVLYRCRNCGGLVFFDHEEIADFLSADNHEDYWEELFPVADIEEARKIAEGSSVGNKPKLSRTWCSRWEEPECWKVCL